MVPAEYTDQASVPSPPYHRRAARALHLDALRRVTQWHLLALCRVAVVLAYQQCKPVVPSSRARPA